MADVTLESTEEIIQLVSVSGASQGDIVAAVAVETAAREAADTAHAALTTGVHGVGASTVASAANVASSVAAHNALATAHGLTGDDWAAIQGAASPSAGNVLATIADTRPYSDFVMALRPLAYYKLNEAVGTSGAGSVIDSSGNAYHATPTAVTFGVTGIGDGQSAVSVDGTTSVIDCYSAALATAFTGLEIGVSVWFKVAAASVWTDGADRDIIHWSANDGGNEFRVVKSSTNNTLLLVWRSGSVTRTASLTITSINSTDWIHAAISQSVSGAYVRFYVNGVKIAADQTVGTWNAALVALTTCIGAYQNTPAGIFNGSIAHAAVFSKAPNDAQVALLYQFGVFF